MLDSSALCSIFMDHQHRTAGLGGKQCTHKSPCPGLISLISDPSILSSNGQYQTRFHSGIALLKNFTALLCWPLSWRSTSRHPRKPQDTSCQPIHPHTCPHGQLDSSQHRYRLWWWTKTQTWPSSHPETTFTHAERHSWTQGSWHWHFEKYAFPPSFCSYALLGKQGSHHKPSTWRAAAHGSVGTIQPRISTGLLWDGSGQWTHSLDLCLNTGCFLSRGPQLPIAPQRAQPCRYQSSIQRQELQHSMGRSFWMPDLAEYFIGMQDATPDPGAEKKL